MQTNFVQASYNSDLNTKRFANMCTIVLKERLSFFANNYGSVLCTFLDATKALAGLIMLNYLNY